MDRTAKPDGPAPNPLNIAEYRYRAMIGTGGIGWGTFFALNGDRTLGREESRSGRFLDHQDYCKLHIVAHYVQTLLGPDFAVLPVAKVGDDDPGRRLIEEMKDAGILVDHVRRVRGARTLFSFCFVYPDGSGGNLTTADSACSTVDAAFVDEAEPDFDRFETRGIALAAPEVPLDARRRLLELGTQYRFFRAAAFTSGEMQTAIKAGLLAQVDLLAMNLDEAAAAADVPADGEPLAIVKAAINTISQDSQQGDCPDLSITAGPAGNWSWDGASLVHVPRYEANAVSTAGAGDAHLAGILVGLVAGLTLAEAQQLATLVAALSVTSPHTINKDIDRLSLRQFAQESRPTLPPAVRRLLEE